jgi:hypothetical protein
LTDLIKDILDLSKTNDVEKLEILIESRLEHEPYNCDLWLRLAVLELAPPISDYYKSVDSIKKVLSNKNNATAALLLAYVNYYCLGGVDDELLNNIKIAVPDNVEFRSMLKYAESWFYDGKDSKMQEACLRESIEIYNGHVWNNYYLAKLYFVDGKEVEGKVLINKALENVVTVYSDESYEYDITSVDEFINEHIKGICLTQENYESIKNPNL